MGYRSNVRILMGRKGFEAFKAVVNEESAKSENKYNLLENTDVLQVRKDEVIIGWDYIKWYEDYEDVKAVNAGLEKLTELAEADENTLKDNFYKIVIIGEDGAVDSYSNDDDEFTCDLYDSCGFSDAGEEQNNTKLYAVWIHETESWYYLRDNQIESFVEKSNVTYEIEVDPAGVIVKDDYKGNRAGELFETHYGMMAVWGNNNPPLPKVSLSDVAGVMEAIEQMLDDAGVTIPDDHREGAEDEARLFGGTYYDLEAKVYDILNGRVLKDSMN